MSSVNVEQWEAEVFADHRVNPLARRVAKTLADHFREGGGSCQLSADKLADAAGIVDVSTARNGLHRLKRYGWIIAEHVPRTKKRGLVYRPIMSVSAARSRWPTPRLSCYSSGGSIEALDQAKFTPEK